MKGPQNLTTPLNIDLTATNETATTARLTCNADQLSVKFKGADNASGNGVARFWIADTSSSPCALRTAVTVDLVDGKGTTHLSASAAFVPSVSLTAHSSIPKGLIPPQDQQLAFVLISWPLDSATGATRSSTSLACAPGEAFAPDSVKLTFDGVAPVTLHAADFGHQKLTVCGHQLVIGTEGLLVGLTS